MNNILPVAPPLVWVGGVADYSDKRVRVCQFLCLCASISPEPHLLSLLALSCMLPVAEALSSSGCFAIRYVHPFFMDKIRRREKSVYSK